MTVDKPKSKAVVSLDIKTRITDNPFFGRDLRRRLESDAARGTAMRELLDSLTDAVVEQWHRHHKAGLAHAERKARGDA
jgi:hypothetical protein